MIGKVFGWLAGAAAACFAYGVVIEPRAFRVRRGAIAVLPPGHMPLRVLHISDIHLLSRQRPKREFIRRLAALEPDLVVDTGDNIAEPEAIAALTSDLGPLLTVPGVFVFGSNDYRRPVFRNWLGYLLPSKHEDGGPRDELPVDDLRDALSSQGWIDLTHRRARLEINGTQLEFRGTDDAHENRDEYETVAGKPSPGVDVSVGVTHAPYLRILDAMTKDHVDLVLAGHTHGGQLCVPGYGALISNCDLPPQNARGIFRHRRRKLSTVVHVSAGLGMSPFAPFRFACRPEVTLLRLVPRPE